MEEPENIIGRSGRLAGNAASFLAYLIFGFNIVFCKDVANSGLVPQTALFCLRMTGAAALFWIVSLFFGREEKVERRDLPRIALASLLGLFITQLSFLLAVPRASAVDLSMFTLLTPVCTMIIAAIAIGDRITGRAVAGLVTSLAGVVFLVLTAVAGPDADRSTTPLGFALMIVNILSFSLYLGVFKPLIRKYGVVTFMKWMFLFSAVYSAPLAVKSIPEIQFGLVGARVAWEVFFVVFFSTFVAYFLIPIGQKRLKPMLVCMYSYIQPVVAMVMSVAMGLDSLSAPKIAAALLVFAGVGIVSYSK